MQRIPWTLQFYQIKTHNVKRGKIIGMEEKWGFNTKKGRPRDTGAPLPILNITKKGDMMFRITASISNDEINNHMHLNYTKIRHIMSNWNDKICHDMVDI